jgi:hypothetical protein
MDILTAFANYKGWVTAKAGRPDIHRAGNASMTSLITFSPLLFAHLFSEVLRALAEGRIGWAFWPPGTAIASVMMDVEPGAGIWAPHVMVQDEGSEHESEDEDGEQPSISSESEEESEYEESAEENDDNPPPGSGVGLGRFGALILDADEDAD